MSSGKLPKQVSLDVPLCLRTTTNSQVNGAWCNYDERPGPKGIVTDCILSDTSACCAIALYLLSVLLAVKAVCAVH